MHGFNFILSMWPATFPVAGATTTTRWAVAVTMGLAQSEQSPTSDYWCGIPETHGLWNIPEQNMSSALS
jgi:hypothetical protein